MVPLDCIWIRASHFNLGLEVSEKTYMMITTYNYQHFALMQALHGPVEWLLKWGRPGGLNKL